MSIHMKKPLTQVCAREFGCAKHKMPSSKSKISDELRVKKRPKSIPPMDFDMKAHEIFPNIRLLYDFECSSISKKFKKVFLRDGKTRILY